MCSLGMASSTSRMVVVVCDRRGKVGRGRARTRGMRSATQTDFPLSFPVSCPPFFLIVEGRVGGTCRRYRSTHARKDTSPGQEISDFGSRVVPGHRRCWSVPKRSPSGDYSAARRWGDLVPPHRVRLWLESPCYIPGMTQRVLLGVRRP